MTAPTDADIIRASLGDPHAFGSIFTRHVDAVHAYLARRAGRGGADDLTGEVFRIAFEQRRKFDLGRSSARPWLYGIAANVLRRHQRDSWRRGRAHRRFQLRQPTATVDIADASAASTDAARQRDGLEAAVRSLARRDREVLLLHVWEQLAYSEIAEALGIPVGTVRSRLHRARRQLRARLGSAQGHGSDDQRRLAVEGPEVA